MSLSTRISLASLLFASGLLAANASLASELRYRPTNPSFGGNPLNSAYLQYQASANNQHQNDNTLTTQDTITDLVTRSVSFEIANNINSAIFGEGASPSDSAALGDGSFVSWERVGSSVTVTFTGVDGSTTTFVVPDP